MGVPKVEWFVPRPQLTFVSATWCVVLSFPNKPMRTFFLRRFAGMAAAPKWRSPSPRPNTSVTPRERKTAALLLSVSRQFPNIWYIGIYVKVRGLSQRLLWPVAVGDPEFVDKYLLNAATPLRLEVFGNTGSGQCSQCIGTAELPIECLEVYAPFRFLCYDSPGCIVCFP